MRLPGDAGAQEAWSDEGKNGVGHHKQGTGDEESLAQEPPSRPLPYQQDCSQKPADSTGRANRRPAIGKAPHQESQAARDLREEEKGQQKHRGGRLTRGPDAAHQLQQGLGERDEKRRIEDHMHPVRVDEGACDHRQEGLESVCIRRQTGQGGRLRRRPETLWKQGSKVKDRILKPRRQQADHQVRRHQNKGESRYGPGGVDDGRLAGRRCHVGSG